MQAQKIVEFKLQPALAEISLHRQRLHQAWLESCEYEPFRQPGSASAAPLTDAQGRTLDQLVFRFGRL